jgi:outer membrane protein assembly factor BamB
MIIHTNILKRNVSMVYKSTILLFLFSSIISCSKDDYKSPENEISSFKLPVNDNVYEGEINQTTGKITFIISEDIPNSIIPNVQLPNKVNVIPNINSARNFNSILRYTVTAENGLEKVYTVVVYKSELLAENLAPGAMKLESKIYEGRKLILDWSDAEDSDEVYYSLFKNDIKIGDYSTSNAKIDYSYNATEDISIYATDKKGGVSILEFSLENPKSELILVRNEVGVLFAIDTKEKDVLWAKPAEKDRFDTPPIANNQVITATDEGLFGLDILTGESIVKYNDNDGKGYYYDFASDESQFYYRKSTTGIAAHNYKENKESWRIDNYSHNNTPFCISNEYLYIFEGKETINAINKSNGAINSSFTSSAGATNYTYPTPLIIDNSIFIGDKSIIYHLNKDLNIGKWFLAGISGPRSFNEYNGNVIITTDIEVYAIEIETGKTLWKRSVANSSPSHPFIYNDKLYLGLSGNGYGNMLCLDAKTGNILWLKKTERSVKASPVVFEGKLYFTDQAGYLQCFDAETGAFLWKITIGSFISSSTTFVKGNSETIIYPSIVRN